jgi:hypothetical protein
MKLQEDLLRGLATDYLLPLFSGATLKERAERSTARDKLVAYSDPCSVAFKVQKSDTYRLVITRAQSFTASAADKIPEISVIQSFVDIVSSMGDMIDGPFRRDILTTFQRRVIARALMNGRYEDSLLAAIDQLAHWGSRLYEGAPISAAIGLRNTRSADGLVSLEEFSAEDFGAVLSNGHDTIIEFNYDQKFLRHQTPAAAAAADIPSFCPFRQGVIAGWTTVHEDRIALTLNRLGEILAFRDQRLVFARRSGTWHFLTHEPVIKQMNVPRDPDLRRAIYETCLDASFARTGACVGVVQLDGAGKWTELVAPDDLLVSGTTIKTTALRKAIRGRKFQEIDRQARQELTAIDGATIVSHTGDLLAVGAILKIGSGGSVGGGGRLAATRALSKSGLGIKVSQDGSITGYRARSSRPVFRVM